MLNNIKSNFFIKLIFLHIDEEIKLDLLKYNKSLQSSINISILNYKTLTDKYIIYEGKERKKGKEYNKNGVLIYQGEYLNGKRNGVGEEYDHDGVFQFKGEFLNGKKWNLFKGEHYLENGKGLIREKIYIVILYLTGNIQTEKGMEKEENMILAVIQYSKENI